MHVSLPSQELVPLRTSLHNHTNNTYTTKYTFQAEVAHFIEERSVSSFHIL
jgi:hypothetical protein